VNTIAQKQALRLLKENLNRHIYEAGNLSLKKGSGRYFVTYTDDNSPELRQDDIDALVKGGVIKEKFPGFYELT
jgi:hypothetical protein